MSANDFALDTLLAEACVRAGGLDDFGPGDFRQGLVVLADALEKEARLSVSGRGLLREKLLAQLVNRLIIRSESVV